MLHLLQKTGQCPPNRQWFKQEQMQRWLSDGKIRIRISPSTTFFMDGICLPHAVAAKILAKPTSAEALIQPALFDSHGSIIQFSAKAVMWRSWEPRIVLSSYNGILERNLEQEAKRRRLAFMSR